MTKSEVMKQLRAAGTAQNRKVYRNHGVEGDLFGVSYAVLGKLRKKIKTDQDLAEQLWRTENHDARVLATMIADPSTIKAGTLDGWVRESGIRMIAAAVSDVAAETAGARKRMEKWIRSRDEMIACAGWHTLASIARQDNGLPNGYFSDHLRTIETKIHKSKNWVRYAMNNTLINIGIRNAALQKKAIAAAKRIGKVEVDHGATSCSTPDAASYIVKTVEHYKKKGKR